MRRSRILPTLLPLLLAGAFACALPSPAEPHFWGAAGGASPQGQGGAPAPPPSRPPVEVPVPRHMTVNLYADTSLKEAAADASVVFLAANPWARVVPLFAPAGEIADRLRRGEEADVVLLPDGALARRLAEEGLLLRDTVFALGRFPLVFAGREGVRARRLADLASLSRVVSADPARHPSGAYALEALRNCGADGELAARLDATAPDGREALAAVARGEADGAFAFRIDAGATPSVRILFVVPRSLHAPAEATVAFTPRAGNNDGALAFLRFLRSETGRGVLARQGIEPCN